MPRRPEHDANRLDDAARAGWLYYVAGNTQDEIARKLGVSRQSAQRLVALSMSAGLIKVRLDHPIARCMELRQAVMEQYGLSFCDIVPTDPASNSTTLGVAESTAGEMERYLRSPEPKIIGLGTGRTMRAAVSMLPPMDCPQHKIVSLTGNIAPDGSASYFDVIFRIGEIVNAPHYPLTLPVVATTGEEREMFLAHKSVRDVLKLASQADVTFVGIGDLGKDAAILVDGFMTGDELWSLNRAGAVGEIAGWAYDGEGRLIDGLTNDRIASARLDQPATRPI